MIARIATGSSCADSAVPSAIAAASSSMNRGLPPAACSICSAAASGSGTSRSSRRASSRAVFGGERLERDCRCGAESRRPSSGRASSSSPLASGEEHRRDLPDVGGHPLDQVEQARVGPVDVLEDEQRGLLPGYRFDEVPRRGEEHRALVDRVLGEARRAGRRAPARSSGSRLRSTPRSGARASLRPRREDPSRRFRRAPESSSRTRRSRCSPRRAATFLEPPDPPCSLDEVGQLAAEPRLPHPREIRARLTSCGCGAPRHAPRRCKAARAPPRRSRPSTTRARSVRARRAPSTSTSTPRR